MLKSAREFFRKYLDRDAATAVGSGASSLAVAALLVEILRADFDVSPEERREVLASLERILGLAPDACVDLLAVAESHIDRSHDLYQFTSEVNRAYTPEEKLRLLEQLWRVAHADARMHKYEEHLIRRIADLLHVPHSGFISAKLRSQADMT